MIIAKPSLKPQAQDVNLFFFGMNKLFWTPLPPPRPDTWTIARLVRKTRAGDPQRFGFPSHCDKKAPLVRSDLQCAIGIGWVQEKKQRSWIEAGGLPLVR